MASIQVALVRHGAYRQPPGVPSALLPYPLSEEGRAQARAAAENLALYVREARVELHPVIDCSPLLRAFETAQLLCGALAERGVTGCALEEFEALMERSLGALANLTEAQIAQVVADDPRLPALPPGWKRSTDFRLPFPGAETLRDAGRRVARHVLQRTDASTAGAPLLKVFVGHGGAFRHAARELGVLSESDVSKLSMYHALPVYLEKSAGGFRQLAGSWKPREPEELE